MFCNVQFRYQSNILDYKPDIISPWHSNNVENSTISSYFHRRKAYFVGINSYFSQSYREILLSSF